VLVSFAALAELYDVLSRKQFRRYVDEEEVRSFLAALTREAQWIDVEARIKACRDPKDDKFLELAVSGQGTHIVTGDIDLLVLIPFRGIELLPPHRFLEIRKIEIGRGKKRSLPTRSKPSVAALGVTVPIENLVWPITASAGPHVICYTASLHLVDFKCASSFGEAQPNFPE